MVCLPEQECWVKLLLYLPDSTLGIGTVPALDPIAGSQVKTCCKRSSPPEISPVNVSVDLVPQPFTSSLVPISDYFDRPQNVRFQRALRLVPRLNRHKIFLKRLFQKEPSFERRGWR